jgi:cholesterol transport system auxiliary component
MIYVKYYKCLFLLSILSVVAMTFSACSLVPEKREPPTVFDLGPQNTATAFAPVINATLLIPTVSASPWLDNTNIYYRLNYKDASRPEVYAQNHWTMSPALLFTERLRARFAAASRGVVTAQDGAKADYALRIELEDFSQSFDDAQRSKVSVRLRASLVDVTTRALHAQRSFIMEKPAAPNAPGAAQSLASASDAAIEALIAWAQQNLKK